ncbi:hypothetical protein N9N67_07865 [Bacteriovoracaceae bacterium]|nr:hypothetical protein [Bacteriovoracaceae bacterium]
MRIIGPKFLDLNLVNSEKKIDEIKVEESTFNCTFSAIILFRPNKQCYFGGPMKRVLFVIFICTQSFAYEMDDKTSFIQKFEKLVKNKNFTSYHDCQYESLLNIPVDNYELLCENGYCDLLIETQDKYFVEKTKSCSESLVKVISEAGSIKLYTPELFERKNKNYLSEFFAWVESEIGYDLKFIINGSKESLMTVGHLTGNTRKIRVLNVLGEAKFTNYDHFEPFVLTVSSKLSAQLQVLRFRLSDTNIFRVEDFK